MLVTAVFLSGMAFSAVAQNISMMANNIDIRSGYLQFHTPNAFAYTYHYGNLIIEPSGGNFSQGYLYSRGAYVNGFMTVAGGDFEVIAGVKRFIHPHPQDPDKVVRYITMESAEALTVTRGTAKTVNGQVTIMLPEHFSMVTSKEAPVTVVLTPEGAPVLFYVKDKNTEKITVAMKASDFSEFRDVEFSYQVTGVRDGFEKQEVIVDVDKLDELATVKDSEKNEVQKRMDALVERVNAKQELKPKGDE